MPSERDWFSADVVRRLPTRERLAPAELDTDGAAFVERNLADIEARFEERLDETVRELRRLERTRAKELFG